MVESSTCDTRSVEVELISGFGTTKSRSAFLLSDFTPFIPFAHNRFYVRIKQCTYRVPSSRNALVLSIGSSEAPCETCATRNLIKEDACLVIWVQHLS